MASNNQADLRQIFADAFKRYGPPTNAPDAEVSIPYPVQHYFPSVYCDFVDTDEINALASIHKGHELVAIFAGLLHFISPFYAAFLCDPQMFNEIGNPNKNEGLGEMNAMLIDFMKRHPTRGFAPLSPCRIRSRVTIRLIFCCNLFIHAHEVGHIVLGHLDLLRSRFGIDTYEELPAVRLSQEECELRRALELQADQSAALTSLHLFRQQFDPPSELDEFRDADLLWSIAIESLFLLLDLAMIRKGMSRRTTHPTPFTRWLSVKLSVGERAEEHGIKRLQIPGGGSRPVRDIRNWLINHGFGSSEMFGVTDADAAADELFSTWKGIEPYLDSLERYRARRGDRAATHV